MYKRIVEVSDEDIEREKGELLTEQHVKKYVLLMNGYNIASVHPNGTMLHSNTFQILDTTASDIITWNTNGTSETTPIIKPNKNPWAIPRWRCNPE